MPSGPRGKQPKDFAAHTTSAGHRVLVFCDIEGAERDLLDPVAEPALAGMDIIVESHECLVPGINAELQRPYFLPDRVLSYMLPLWCDWSSTRMCLSLACAQWVTIYFGWRPNLPDEADNHLVELALAGGAAGIVTHNVRDLGPGELVFDQLRVLTPAQCLEKWQ